MCASAQISYSLFAQRPSRVLQGLSCVLLKLPRALLAAATSRPFRQAGFSHLNRETAWSRPAGGNLQRILCTARPLAYHLLVGAQTRPSGFGSSQPGIKLPSTTCEDCNRCSGFQVPFVRGTQKGQRMQDRATYRRYAEECRRLATAAPDEHRRVLLEIAEAWTKLAQESGLQESAGRK